MGLVHLKDRGFELQLVPPDILSKALKRRNKKMVKGIDHGWQKTAEGAPQGTGIIMGRNLRSYKKPNDTTASDEVSETAKEKKPNKE
ncbi:MAG: hypothetical protein VX780_04690 [Pseudomonadota bacterium]|nr:hypothetical protein [Pseudomonadota bacterium]